MAAKGGRKVAHVFLGMLCDNAKCPYSIRKVTLIQLLRVGITSPRSTD